MAYTYRCTACGAHFRAGRKRCGTCGTVGKGVDREHCLDCGSLLVDSEHQQCPGCGSRDVERTNDFWTRESSTEHAPSVLDL